MSFHLTRVAIALLLLPLALCGCAAPGKGTSLVVISLDTVRRDHLPVYGYGRDTAPAITELAARSSVFDVAIAQDTNTNPSHASMFTGVYPPEHGSEANLQPLDPAQVTLAEILQRAGLRTGAFVSSVIMQRQLSGLARGFEIYEDGFSEARRDGAATVRLALDWLGGLNPDDRYFLFVHLFDAHGPYRPHDAYAGLFSSADPGPHLERIPGYQNVPDAAGKRSHSLAPYIDRYDGTIRYLDDLVARVLAAVDLESTVVVVLADHGETLGERFWTLDHGGQVFDEQVRIPLIVHAPGIGPRRVGELVESVDLLPTLLDLLRIERPEERPVQGRDLVPVMRGEEDAAGRLTFTSARTHPRRHADRGYRLNPGRRIRAVRSARYKLILYPGIDYDYLELYDLVLDPGERRNLAATMPAVRDAYLDHLKEWVAQADHIDARPEPDKALYDKLRTLGYAGG